MTCIQADVPFKSHTGAQRFFFSISQDKGILRFDDDTVVPFILLSGYRGYGE